MLEVLARVRAAAHDEEEQLFIAEAGKLVHGHVRDGVRVEQQLRLSRGDIVRVGVIYRRAAEIVDKNVVFIALLHHIAVERIFHARAHFLLALAIVVDRAHVHVSSALEIFLLVRLGQNGETGALIIQAHELHAEQKHLRVLVERGHRDHLVLLVHLHGKRGIYADTDISYAESRRGRAQRHAQGHRHYRENEQRGDAGEGDVPPAVSERDGLNFAATRPASGGRDARKYLPEVALELLRLVAQYLFDILTLHSSSSNFFFNLLIALL